MDADVLVHVVDASGQADTCGNIAEVGSGSTPSEDAQVWKGADECDSGWHVLGLRLKKLGWFQWFLVIFCF